MATASIQPQESDISDGDRVAMLVRIYRSAVLSGDRELARSARKELAKLGISVGEARR